MTFDQLGIHAASAMTAPGGSGHLTERMKGREVSSAQLSLSAPPEPRAPAPRDEGRVRSVGRPHPVEAVEDEVERDVELGIHVAASQASLM